MFDPWPFDPYLLFITIIYYFILLYIIHYIYGGFPKIEVPHSWMIYNGKSYSKMDENWGYPYFRKPPSNGYSRQNPMKFDVLSRYFPMIISIYIYSPIGLGVISPVLSHDIFTSSNQGRYMFDAKKRDKIT
jgi:hypothetical protein